jgi:hypothetical protein
MTTFAFVRQRNQYNVWILSGKYLHLSGRETSTMFGFCQENICICQAEKPAQCLDSVRKTFAFVRQRNQYNVWILSGKHLHLSSRETSTMFGFGQDNICICKAEKAEQCFHSVSTAFASVRQRTAVFWSVMTAFA